jgi:hypothetical protein
MTELREFSVTLIDWETRYILHSISNELQRLKIVSESSADEDESTDAANDFIELSGLYERLIEKAVSVFGEQINNFSFDLM